MKTNGDMRMLGTRDGLAHALVWVRSKISEIDGLYAPRIEPRHTRKRAARDAVLRPLKDLEARITQSHSETQAAYEATRQEIPAPLHDGHLLASMVDGAFGTR